MYETINDLFFGCINPYEARRDLDRDYAAAQKRFNRLYDQLMDKLSDSALQERFTDALSELAQEQERVMFCRGFRLGMRLAAESCSDSAL